MMEAFCSLMYVAGLSRCDIGKNDGAFDFILILNRLVFYMLMYQQNCT